MARPVYSHRFLAVRGLVGAVFISVPAGFTMVVRDIDAFGDPTISGSDLFAVGTDDQSFWWNNFPVDQRSYGSWRGRQVFNDSESWHMFCSGDPIDVTVSGYLLTNP